MTMTKRTTKERKLTKELRATIRQRNELETQLAAIGQFLPGRNPLSLEETQRCINAALWNVSDRLTSLESKMNGILQAAESTESVMKKMHALSQFLNT